MTSRILYSSVLLYVRGFAAGLASVDAFAQTATINASNDITIYQGSVPNDVDDNKNL